jgi:hypothetical protein
MNIKFIGVVLALGFVNCKFKPDGGDSEQSQQLTGSGKITSVKKSLPLIFMAMSLISRNDVTEAGNANSVPVVSQLKSLGQAMTGDLEGARQTQEEFSKVSD